MYCCFFHHRSNFLYCVPSRALFEYHRYRCDLPPTVAISILCHSGGLSPDHDWSDLTTVVQHYFEQMLMGSAMLVDDARYSLGCTLGKGWYAYQMNDMLHSSESQRMRRFLGDYDSSSPYWERSRLVTIIAEKGFDSAGQLDSSANALELAGGVGHAALDRIQDQVLQIRVDSFQKRTCGTRSTVTQN